MAGLTKPSGWPASWSARAISPAQNGAAALVPPSDISAYAPPGAANTKAMPVDPEPAAATSGTPRIALMPGTSSWYAGRTNRLLNPPPDACECPSINSGNVFNAVSPTYAPVTGLAVSVVPPTASTSGSEAGRLTSLTGVDEPNFPRSLIAPPSPDEATKVTWRAAEYFSAELMAATSAGVAKCSP